MESHGFINATIKQQHSPLLISQNVIKTGNSFFQNNSVNSSNSMPMEKIDSNNHLNKINNGKKLINRRHYLLKSPKNNNHLSSSSKSIMMESNPYEHHIPNILEFENFKNINSQQQQPEHDVSYEHHNSNFSEFKNEDFCSNDDELMTFKSCYNDDDHNEIYNEKNSGRISLRTNTRHEILNSNNNIDFSSIKPSPDHFFLDQKKPRYNDTPYNDPKTSTYYTKTTNFISSPSISASNDTAFYTLPNSTVETEGLEKTNMFWNTLEKKAPSNTIPFQYSLYETTDPTITATKQQQQHHSMNCLTSQPTPSIPKSSHLIHSSNIPKSENHIATPLSRSLSSQLTTQNDEHPNNYHQESSSSSSSCLIQMSSSIQPTNLNNQNMNHDPTNDYNNYFMKHFDSNNHHLDEQLLPSTALEYSSRQPIHVNLVPRDPSTGREKYREVIQLFFTYMEDLPRFYFDWEHYNFSLKFTHFPTPPNLNEPITYHQVGPFLSRSSSNGLTVCCDMQKSLVELPNVPNTELIATLLQEYDGRTETIGKIRFPKMLSQISQKPLLRLPIEGTGCIRGVIGLIMSMRWNLDISKEPSRLDTVSENIQNIYNQPSQSFTNCKDYTKTNSFGLLDSFISSVLSNPKKPNDKSKQHRRNGRRNGHSFSVMGRPLSVFCMDMPDALCG